MLCQSEFSGRQQNPNRQKKHVTYKVVKINRKKVKQTEMTFRPNHWDLNVASGSAFCSRKSLSSGGSITAA